MTPVEKQPQADDLPVLTEVADEAEQDDLPTLTEVVEAIHPALPPIEIPSLAADGLPVLVETVTPELPPAAVESLPVTALVPTPSLSDADMRLLMQRLEDRIESMFAQKLSRHLEQLQRHAIEQTIAEFKAELPQILNDALRGSYSDR